MAQAGIHGMVGTAVRKLAPEKEWLMLGVILGVTIRMRKTVEALPQT